MGLEWLFRFTLPHIFPGAHVLEARPVWRTTLNTMLDSRLLGTTTTCSFEPNARLASARGRAMFPDIYFRDEGLKEIKTAFKRWPLHLVPLRAEPARSDPPVGHFSQTLPGEAPNAGAIS